MGDDSVELRDRPSFASRRVFASSFRCRARNFLIALNNALRVGIPRAFRSKRLLEVAVKRTAPWTLSIMRASKREKEREGGRERCEFSASTNASAIRSQRDRYYHRESCLHQLIASVVRACRDDISNRLAVFQKDKEMLSGTQIDASKPYPKPRTLQAVSLLPLPLRSKTGALSILATANSDLSAVFPNSKSIRREKARRRKGNYETPNCQARWQTV